MATQTERACFVIADISGYTAYLTSSEIDHAQDVLADVLETVIGILNPTLRLVKLEGDAIFAYAPEADLDGSLLLDVLESAYFAFQRRLQAIRDATTCQCNACRTIPHLNLKFLVHHGGFVRQRIMGQEELAGSDVILVHRLMKNAVGERGLHAYGLFTEACVTTLRLDPAAQGMAPHQETYEFFGTVRCYVYDLQAAWRRHQETRRVLLTPEAADLVVESVLPAPLPLVWEWLSDARRRPRWMADVVRVDQETPGGRRGVGTTNHCVHGQDAHLEEMLDWRPLEYSTWLIRSPVMGEVTTTCALTPVEGGTLARILMRLESPEMRAMMDDPTQREAMVQMAEEMRAGLHDSFTQLAERLREDLALRQDAVESAARAQLQETAAHYWGSRDGWVQASS